MEFKEVINLRHSVRSFEPKKVPKKILRKVIKDAIKAPSACNNQPWLFYIIESKNTRDEVATILRNTIPNLKSQTDKKKTKFQKITYDFYDNLGNAQNIVFIYRKKGLKEPVWKRPMEMYSIACASENLMLSATANGLGTCWIGTFQEKKTEQKLRKLINLSDDHELHAAILIGYPAKDFTRLKRTKKKISDVLTFI